jgi:hypothetical protein
LGGKADSLKVWTNIGFSLVKWNNNGLWWEVETYLCKTNSNRYANMIYQCSSMLGIKKEVEKLIILNKWDIKNSLKRQAL